MNNQQAPKRNILYYSKYCPSCENLVKILRNDNLLINFNMICTDGIEDKIPKQIQQVPAILDVTVQQLFQGKETFEWLQRVKFLRQQAIIEHNKKLVEYNNLVKKQQEQQLAGPPGVDVKDIGEFSDKFADINSDAAQQKSFMSYGDDDKFVIFTAPNEKVKISSSEQKARTELLEQGRSVQNDALKNIMMQGQLNAVINREREAVLEQYLKN